MKYCLKIPCHPNNKSGHLRQFQNRRKLKPYSKYNNDLIFGKNPLEEIVCIEVINSEVHIHFNDGNILIKPMLYWVLSNKKFDKFCKPLKGNTHYKYIKTYSKILSLDPIFLNSWRKL